MKPPVVEGPELPGLPEPFAPAALAMPAVAVAVPWGLWQSWVLGLHEPLQQSMAAVQGWLSGRQQVLVAQIAGAAQVSEAEQGPPGGEPEPWPPEVEVLAPVPVWVLPAALLDALPAALFDAWPVL